MRYLLKKDWDSKRHNKTINKGVYVVITLEDEIKELIELGCIEKPKVEKKSTGGMVINKRKIKKPRGWRKARYKGSN